MATVNSPPALASTRASSYDDEKLPFDKERGDIKSIASKEIAEVGDVSADVRDIDIGENGKERPIGMHLVPSLILSGSLISS